MRKKINWEQIAQRFQAGRRKTRRVQTRSMNSAKVASFRLRKKLAGQGVLVRAEGDTVVFAKE